MRQLMRGRPLAWCVALVITIGLAAFQRATGPTHPVRSWLKTSEGPVKIVLPRSHGGPGDLLIRLPKGVSVLTGSLVWRRFPTTDSWTVVPLVKKRGLLMARIPHQPPAGKVEYHLVLRSSGHRTIVFPSKKAVVARFKGEIPIAVLVLHILFMFLSMLFATRAVLAAIGWDERATRPAVLFSAIFLIVGGFVLGPIVQHYAFGAFWTGWPYGYDLTDNKTLLAFLAWLPAVVCVLRGKTSRLPIVAGWIVMMAVFLVPHSLHGSQIDWSSAPSSQTRRNAILEPSCIRRAHPVQIKILT